MSKTIKFKSIEILKQTFDKSTWFDANLECEILNLDDNGWRLPTIDELKSFNSLKSTLKIDDNEYFWSSEKTEQSGRCCCIGDMTSAKVKLLCKFPYFVVKDIYL